MIVYDIIGLIAAVGLGIITSYEDIKENKIRNKWVGIAILIGIIIFIARLITVYLTGNSIAPGYVKEFLLNALITFGVGFLLWELKLWNAADSKLILAYALLIPFKFYYKGYRNSFPSFVLFTNTFVPYLVFGFGYSLFKLSKKQLTNILKSIAKQTAGSVFLLVGLMWITQRTFSLINIQFLDNLRMVFVIVLMIVSQKYLKIKLNYLGIALTILALIFDLKYFNISTLIQFLKSLFLYMVVRFFILNTGFKIFSKRVRLADLKPGMVLADEIIETDEKCFLRQKIFISISQAIFQKASYKKAIKNKPQGISKADIKKIAKLRKDKKLDAYSINVAKTIPFAPFLFIGVLTTILSRGSILTVIYILIEKFI